MHIKSMQIKDTEYRPLLQEAIEEFDQRLLECGCHVFRTGKPAPGQTSTETPQSTAPFTQRLVERSACFCSADACGSMEGPI